MGDGGVVTGRACAVRLLVAPVALPGSATGLVHGSASRGPTTRGAAPARGPAAPVLDRYRALNQGPATDQRCIPVANRASTRGRSRSKKRTLGAVKSPLSAARECDSGATRGAKHVRRARHTT